MGRLIVGLAELRSWRWDPPTAAGWLLLLVVAALEGLVWGLFWSAGESNVLSAAGWSALTLALLWFVTFLAPLVVVPARVVLLLLGLVRSWRVFCRDDAGRWPASALGPGPRSRALLARAGRAGRGWLALFWLTSRQAGRAAVVLGAGGFLVGLLVPLHGLTLWPAVTLVIGIVCGTGVFASEQAAGTYRFLGAQRLPLGRVWAAKVVTWLVVAAVAVLALTVGAVLHVAVAQAVLGLYSSFDRPPSFFEHLTRRSPLLEFVAPAVFVTLWLAYGFAVGQFVALIVRKSAVAAVLALLVSSVLLSAWVPSLVCGGLPAWQLYLPPAVLLAATALVMRPWVGERLHSPRAVAVLAGGGVLALGLIAGSLGYRVAEVPDVGEPFDVRGYLASLPTPEENEAGRLIHLAAAEFADRRKAIGEPSKPARPPAPEAPAPGVPENIEASLDDSLNQVLDNGWSAGTPELSRWLDQMFAGEWVNHLRQAATLPLGVVEDPRTLTRWTPMPTANACREIANVIRVRAAQLQAQGDHAGALDQLDLVLALSRHLRHQTVYLAYLIGLAIERAALLDLDRWLDQRGPKPDLLRRALEVLNRHEAATPPPTQYVKAEYLVARRTLQDPTDWHYGFRNGAHRAEAHSEAALMFASLQTPWEQERARRLMNLVFAHSLRIAESDYWQVYTPPEQRADYAQPPSFPKSFGDLLRTSRPAIFFIHGVFVIPQHDTPALARVHAARLRVALALYQVEQGRPAETLDELVPRYLDALPTDPYSGRPFRYRVSQGEYLDWDPTIAPDGPDSGFRPVPPPFLVNPQPPEKYKWVPAGQGILWSTGPDLLDNGGTHQGEGQRGGQHWAARNRDLIFLVPHWPKGGEQR